MNGPEVAPIVAAPIDPFAATDRGSYLDELVCVIREDSNDPAAGDFGTTEAESQEGRLIARTAHFRLRRLGRRIEVRHRLRPQDLDNDIAALIVDELFTPGWLCDAGIFERVFTGLVRSTVTDPVHAWDTFYGNTLDAIRAAWSESPRPDGGHSTIADFAPVYRRCLELIGAGAVLDLGSCFGFLPLMLAERPRNSVTATDIVPGTMRVLETVARQRGVNLSTLVCNAAWVPLPGGAADSVTVVHLLEHLSPTDGYAVLQEAIRLAVQRVVVAVPFEVEPNPAYGHLCTFDLDSLRELGTRTGHPFQVAEYHGGWLVIDKAEPVPAPR